MAHRRLIEDSVKAFKERLESRACKILEASVEGGRWRLKEKKNLAQLARIRERTFLLQADRLYRTAIIIRLRLYNSRFIGELAPAYYNKFEAFLKALENETTD